MHFNIYFKYVFLVIAALLGISLSAVLGWVFYEKESNAIELNFRSDVNDKAAALEQEMLLNLEVLYSIKGLFDSSDNVDPDEFQQLTQSILVRHKDIQALAWIPKINHSNRAKYEEQRQLEYPDFEITEQQEIAGMTRASERDIYFPVYYTEPLSGNETAFGYDLASSKPRLLTLQKSRDTGSPRVTASITLVQDSMTQGFLIFMPVYDGQPATVEKRRERLRGFILGVYRTGDLFTSAIMRTAAKGINLSLIDITNSSVNVLYDSSVSEDATELYSKSSFDYQKQLAAFAGRTWAITANPTNGYIAERRTILPYATVTFGIFLVIVLTIYTFVIMRHSASIEITVQERTKDLNDAKKKLEALSRTDGLTNIGNRRAFDEILEAEWNRAMRDKTPLSLLMIDIDYFKLFNDKYGHAAGDKCLKDIAHTMEKSLRRANDKVARYGGEEFVMILPNTKDAYSCAEDCRRNIENLRVIHEDSSVSKYVTVSIGVATIVPEVYAEPIELINNADRALYEAKENGRNQAVRMKQIHFNERQLKSV